MYIKKYVGINPLFFFLKKMEGDEEPHRRIDRHAASLDLITTSFTSVVENVKLSRESLGSLLERVKQMYEQLIKKLMGDINAVQAHYRKEKQRLSKELLNTQVDLQSRVDSLQTRLRVLSQSNIAKDLVIDTSKRQLEECERENEFLRELLVSEVALSKAKARSLVPFANDREEQHLIERAKRQAKLK